MNTSDLNKQCFDIKKRILDMAFSTGSAGCHIGGSLSLVELITVLYNRINLTPLYKNNRDRIILSKGHGAMALYSALFRKGLISEEEIISFDKNGTDYFAHPHRNVSKGLEFSGGSLGLGLSYAVGVALAGKKSDISYNVYAIVGDGECDEGIVWEALIAASNYKLNNLTVIVDKNGYQLDGPTSLIMDNSDLSEKFKAFGFDTIEINGHDFIEIQSALNMISDKPKAIIANTIKANGISFLVNNKASHHSALSPKKYQQALDELKNAYGLE